MLAAAISEATPAKATALTKTGMSFPDKQHERFQHHLKRHLCLGFARLSLCSRCDARIHALNKRLARIAAARVRTLPCWWFWASWTLYTCTLSLLTIWPDIALQMPQLPVISPRLNPHTNINWNAGGKCVDYFSSLFVLPLQYDQCKLLRFLACITGESGCVARLHLFCLP